MTSESKAPLIELRGVSKSFGPTRALSNVSFAVRPGEVHVLAGENGAGKSTLIRILSGVITDFEGDLFIAGERVSLRDARDASRRGIATIHQELSLIGSMTVAENLALASRGSFFGWTRATDDETAARRLLEALDLDIDPRALVESLPLAAQQLLEIGRALAQDARVLILDEPTSALSEAEADRLLSRVETLTEKGCGVVYISHRMEENDRIAHRITVLCDGRVVASRPARDLPQHELVALMMGQPKDRPAPPHVTPSRAEPAPAGGAAPDENTHRAVSRIQAMTVRNLRLSEPFAAKRGGVSFSIDQGEIVGLSGLRGAGAGETLAALFGVFGPKAQGEVTLAGAPFVIESPSRSIKSGVLYLAGDRKKTVHYDLNVTENVTLSSLPGLSRHGVLSPARETEEAERMTTRLRVAAPSLEAPLRSLSGGNQQKVALLRALAARPKVLLLDEPTRGVDIGAKAEIHRALREAAAQGTAIALVASELPELIDLCDRVLVFVRGRIATVIEKKDLSQEALRLALEPANDLDRTGKTSAALER